MSTDPSKYEPAVRPSLNPRLIGTYTPRAGCQCEALAVDDRFAQKWYRYLQHIFAKRKDVVGLGGMFVCTLVVF